jgi:hypothetical protein
MSTAYGLLLFWLSFSLPFVAFFQVADRPRIDSPRPGDVLQGVINIRGSTDVTDFQSADIAFRYEGDQSETWYLIQQSEDKVKGGVLASWDTTTIADGTYRLRVVVNQSDNHTTEIVVPNLRVRNYTPVETDTPEIANGEGVQQTVVLPTVTRSVQPTSTDLPPNPAQVSSVRFSFSLVQGIVYSGVLFVLIGIYLAAHKWRQNK